MGISPSERPPLGWPLAAVLLYRQGWLLSRNLSSATCIRRAWLGQCVETRRVRQKLLPHAIRTGVTHSFQHLLQKRKLGLAVSVSMT